MESQGTQGISNLNVLKLSAEIQARLIHGIRPDRGKVSSIRGLEDVARSVVIEAKSKAVLCNCQISIFLKLGSDSVVVWCAGNEQYSVGIEKKIPFHEGGDAAGNRAKGGLLGWVLANRTSYLAQTAHILKTHTLIISSRPIL